MSGPNRNINGSDNFAALAIAIGVITLIVAAFLGIMAVPATKQLLGNLGLAILLTVIAVLLFTKHEKGRWLAFLTLLFASGFALHALFIGNGMYGGNSGGNEGLNQCSDYFNRELYQQAIDCYKKAGNLGDDFLAKKQLGISYAALGRYSEAAQTFKDIFDQDPEAIRPNISKAYYQLALAENNKGNKQQAIRYQTILRSYDQAMADRLKNEITQ